MRYTHTHNATMATNAKSKPVETVNRSSSGSPNHSIT